MANNLPERLLVPIAQFRQQVTNAAPSITYNTYLEKKKPSTSKPKPSKKQRAEKLTEKDLVAFNLNAAGHEGIRSNMDGSLVIKPCTQAEIDFYQAVQKIDHEDLRAHMPAFMGVLALSQDQTVPANGVGPTLQVHDKMPNELVAHVPEGWLPSNVTADPSSKRTSWKPSGGKKLDTPHAIVLENVASNFVHPNILDIKLGSRLWADDAPESKRRKLDEVAKETTSSSLGFRIAGMKRWVGELSEEDTAKHEDKEKGIEYNNGYLCYNKLYGRSFQAHNVKDGFIEYFGGTEDGKDGRSTFKRDMVPEITHLISEELESMRTVLLKEETRMYSASILIVHEGDDKALSDAWLYETMKSRTKELEERDETVDESDDGGVAKLIDVRLIDFAHATFTPGKGNDENVLQGVRSIIRIFSDLQELVMQ